MASISVAGVTYEIEETFLRSSKLPIQKLLPATEDNAAVCIDRVKFYRARVGLVQYWIKEYTKSHQRGPQWEAEQARKYGGMHDSPWGPIGAVEIFAHDDTAIVMEYLAGYTPLVWIESREIRQWVVRRVEWWLQKLKVKHYDVSENNTMVKDNTVKLVDFSFSNLDAHRERILGEMVAGRL